MSFLPLWKGLVDLRNLRVKPSCLDFLRLPVEVIGGTVGKLGLRADWSKLSSEPVVLTLEDVLVLVRMRKDSDEVKIDPDREQKNAAAAQRSRLEGIQAAWLTDNNNKDSASALTLTKKIADNVQIIIRNIHIRYEDVSATMEPVAFGITLAELSCLTTDSNWIQSFIIGSITQYKLLLLKRFAVYFNLGRNATPVQNISDLLQYFTSYQDESKWNHILHPISGYLRATIPSTGYPIRLTSVLDSVRLILAQMQYQELLEVIGRLSARHKRSVLLAPPFIPVFRSGADVSMIERTKYKLLYKRTLNASWLPAVTPQEQGEQVLFESTVDYAEVVKLRYAVFQELRAELAGKKVTLRENQSAGLWSLFSSVPTGPEVSLSLQDRKRIQDDLDAFSTPIEEEEFPKDFLKVQWEFQLGALGVSLLQKDRAPFLTLMGSDSKFVLRKFPKSSAIEIGLCSVICRDYATIGTQFPEVIRPVVNSESPSTVTSSSCHALSLTIELAPLDGSADMKVSLLTVAQEIVIHNTLVQNLKTFFTPKTQVDFGLLGIF